MSHCLIADCERPVRARGWCHTHYMRWYTGNSIDPPMSALRAMQAIDLGWVAGIIEGEGTFVSSARRHGRLYPKIAVQMTDQDVISRLHAVTGIGTVTTLTVRGLMTKPSYTWRVSRLVDVVALCGAIRALMGARRLMQLDAMLIATQLVNATFPRTRRSFRKDEQNL